jgi:hypothetical protein
VYVDVATNRQCMVFFEKRLSADVLVLFADLMLSDQKVHVLRNEWRRREVTGVIRDKFDIFLVCAGGRF